jgi:hypothetical protein
MSFSGTSSAIGSPKVLLAAAIILVFLWRFESARKKSTREFAASKGYAFEAKLTDTDLHLEETSFFQKGDIIKNVVRGVLPDTTIGRWGLRGAPFALFEHETIRREEGDFTQTIVAFELKTESMFRSATRGPYGVQLFGDVWTIERAGNHVFVWKAQGRIPVRDLEQFLQSALCSFQLSRVHSSLMGG